jgi:hypothetical protein
MKEEQRANRRFSLKLPVSVKYSKGEAEEITAETKDVSAQGIYFFMESQLDEGSHIEFTLTLPPEITLTESIRVRCKGKVVRVETAGEQMGIAAAIDQYDFVSDTQK